MEHHLLIAYCLGEAEASATFYTELHRNVPSSHSASTISKKLAADNVSSVARLRRQLEEQGLLFANTEITRILAARREGMLAAEQCFADQIGPNSCQQRCSQLGDAAETDVCIEACELPASCRGGPLCNEIDIN